MRLVAKLFSNPSVLLIASNIVGLILGLASAALQARLLGPAGRGELARAMVPGSIFAMLLCMGLPDYFSRRSAKGDDMRRLTGTAGCLALIIGIVAVGPYIVVVNVLEPYGTTAWWLLMAYAILSPGFIFGYCVTAISMGASFWRMVAVLKVLPQAVAVLGMLGMLILDLVSALYVGLILISTSLVGLLIPLFRRQFFPPISSSLRRMRLATSFGLRGWPSGSLSLLNQRIDLLLLTVLASAADLGYYAVATTLAAILSALANAVALPTRNHVARGDNSRVPKTTATVVSCTLIVASFVTAGLPWLVSFVLGDEFLPAVPVMMVLLFTQVPRAGIIVVTQCLIGYGRPQSPLVGEATAIATTIALVLFLYPIFGIVGAAFASLGGNILSFGALLYLSNRHITRQRLTRYLFISPRDAWSLAKSLS
ncbi:oligosaccharide flippase family protein [Arthrobacter crystallopoietes]|uniref:Membrane protein involved in the export of O-antigen and teichoic acid n=1 Tax=Crystallibacter crystallopoietes TaxID=37928 RepID=A0A1H0ZRJ9_9MICC|nr:oligosaccharide flippase family protein [Arthrobacter crystallopoietes]AUI51867.1 hypothetical protein AC20117_14780 [Arthrobacter crystallopoietes]SDQ29656.1 Membrane protein involved in the export of O-antigen and teichoic acid [Arthrobacter crystallopoietes]